MLLEKIAQAARCGVDFIQLREKDLSIRDMEILARRAVEAVWAGTNTQLLINSRSDVAIACEADGVHLRGEDISPREARKISRKAGISESVISVSCHTRAEVNRAADQGATFAVFAPVFEKPGTGARPAGLEKLADACVEKIPVLALGGITLENAAECIRAGAAGVAGIRLFQENDLEDTVKKLRALG